MERAIEEEIAIKPSVLDLLLGAKVPNVEETRQTGKFRVDRLSELTGQDVVFEVHGLDYGRVNDIRRFSQDTEVNILLAGCSSPDLKDPRLAKKFGGETPAETVKAMLLPGEIEDLSMQIERLSGYRYKTIEEVKNA